MFSKKAAKEKEAELQLKTHCESCAGLVGGTVGNSEETDQKNCTCTDPGLNPDETGAPALNDAVADGPKESVATLSPSGASENSVDSLESTKASVAFPDLGDRFEVLEFIGEGGMGSVFKVREKTTSAIMAAKVIKTGGCEDAEAVKRFESEVSAATKLTHPNIVATFDHGKTAGGAPYMVMNFIEGETLAKYVKAHGKLEESDAVRVFIAIAEALDYAHQQGLIHRDLKPSNVIVSGDKESKTLDARLVDFGIAKAMTASMARDTQDITKTGEVFGSPAYMSPEQCLGFRLDARSDIYSFGCLMYEALTGRAPVDDDNPVRIVVKQLSDKPKSWTNTPDGKPLKGMEAIVFRCLEKDKEERYQTVAELLKDLNLIAAGKKTAKLERNEFANASLTLGQAMWFIFVGLFLLFYLISVSISFIYTFLSVILFPVASVLSIRHLLRFKFEGTSWNRWQILIMLTMTFLGLTGLIVFSGVFQFWETLPAAFHYYYAFNLVLHKVILSVACGVVLAGFIFQNNGSVSWRRISKQALAISATFLLLGFLPLGPISPIIPSSMVMGLSMSLNANSPKVNIAVAKTSLSLGGDKFWAATRLAECYERLHESAKAIPYLNAALEGNQAQYQIDDMLEHRARAYIAEGNFNGALQDLEKVIKTNGTGYGAASLYELQGDAYEGLGEHEKAISAYQHSLEFGSSMNAAHNKLLGLQIKMRNWKQSIDELNKDIETDHSAQNFLRRAMIYDQANLKDKAKADYKQVVKLLGNIKDVQPEPLFLEEPSMTIYKIVRILNPPENYAKIVGELYMTRAYANHQLGNFDKAKLDIEQGKTRGASFSDMNKKFQDSGLKIEL